MLTIQDPRILLHRRRTNVSDLGSEPVCPQRSRFSGPCITQWSAWLRMSIWAKGKKFGEAAPLGAPDQPCQGPSRSLKPPECKVSLKGLQSVFERSCGTRFPYPYPKGRIWRCREARTRACSGRQGWHPRVSQILPSQLQDVEGCCALRI